MGDAPIRSENPDNWGGEPPSHFLQDPLPLPQARVVGQADVPGILILEMCPVVLIHGFYEFVMT